MASLMNLYRRDWLLTIIIPVLGVTPSASAMNDPAVGRWLTRDPLWYTFATFESSAATPTSDGLGETFLLGNRITSEIDATLLFCLLNNQPTTQADPLGLDAQLHQETAAKLIVPVILLLAYLCPDCGGYELNAFTTNVVCGSGTCSPTTRALVAFAIASNSPYHLEGHFNCTSGPWEGQCNVTGNQYGNFKITIPPIINYAPPGVSCTVYCTINFNVYWHIWWGYC